MEKTDSPLEIDYESENCMDISSALNVAAEISPSTFDVSSRNFSSRTDTSTFYTSPGTVFQEKRGCEDSSVMVSTLDVSTHTGTYS